LGFRRVDAMRLVQNLPCFADASRELGIPHRNIFVQRDLMTLAKSPGVNFFYSFPND
jgi:hypothetical protein